MGDEGLSDVYTETNAPSVPCSRLPNRVTELASEELRRRGMLTGDQAGQHDRVGDGPRERRELGRDGAGPLGKDVAQRPVPTEKARRRHRAVDGSEQVDSLRKAERVADGRAAALNPPTWWR